MQNFLTQVVELQHHVVTIWTTAVASQDFLDHRTSNNVTTSQIFRVRRVTLHEALAMLVDQVATLTAATFGHQHASAGDTGRMELPHFDVLNRHTSTQCHADSVTGVDQRIGSGCIDTTRATGRQHHGLGTDIHRFTVFDTDRDDADDSAILVLHQIYAIPLIEEGGTRLQIGLVQGVQQGMTGAVSRSTGTSRLAALTIVFGLATEWALVNAALLGTGERQPHMFELEHSFRANRTHVFDSILVADVVGALDGIVHMPAPIVVRISRSDSTGDTTLRRNGMRTRRENLGYHRCFMATLCQLQRGTHARATTTDNDGVIRKSTNTSHGSDTPKNLHAPDEESEHGYATHRLEEKTHAGSPLTDSHVGQVVSGNRPHTNPCMNTEGNECKETEDAHPLSGEQRMPLSVFQPRICHEVSDQEEKISRQDHR